QEHESRWQADQLATERRNFAQPLWLGSDELEGKTILLHSEQGFGDSLQFCRYVPLVAARGARVIVEVEEPLCDLITDLDGGRQILAKIFAKGERLPHFDFHCPFPSLPLAFGTQLATIPLTIPYLRSPRR